MQFTGKGKEKRNRGKIDIALLGAIVLGWPALACTTDTNPGLVIKQAQSPKVSELGCSIPASEEETYQNSGTLDVALDRDYGYELYPLVKNMLAMGAMPPTVEYNTINLKGFEVKLRPPPGIPLQWSPACPGEFETLNPTLLEPISSAATIAQVIQPCHAAQIRRLFNAGTVPPSAELRFIAVVRAKGTHGGSTIISDEFEFPITVCAGCLQRGFAGSFGAYDYPATAACANLESNPYLGNPCNPAQDFGPVLCCSRDGTAATIECPGRPLAIPVMP